MQRWQEKEQAGKKKHVQPYNRLCKKEENKYVLKQVQQFSATGKRTNTPKTDGKH